MTNEKNNLNYNKRVAYFDFLRIIAAFAVVIIHVSARLNLEHPTDGIDFYVFQGDFFRWCVPIFVMISGALFLSRDYSIKRLYGRNILRIITSFIFWSLIYAFVNSPEKKINAGFFGAVLDGPGHLWFLFMLIGLYMIVPILKRIVESKSNTVYFLILSLIFVFLIQRVITVYSIVLGREATLITAKIKALELFLPLGYSGYFVLGYYLSCNELGRRAKRIIYVLSFVAVIQTVFFSLLNNGNNVIRTSFKADYLSPTVLIESVAVFVFAKDRLNFNSGAANRKWNSFSNCTFGIYLVHILVMNFIFDIVNIEKFFGSSALLVLPVSMAVFLLSAIISWLINRIPMINRYIV